MGVLGGTHIHKVKHFKRSWSWIELFDRAPGETLDLKRSIENGISIEIEKIQARNEDFSEDFSLLVTFLLVTFSWLFRGPHLLGKTVFGRFSCLFRGPHFGQILRVLALEEKSSEF